jgi:hypothetical protein
MQGWVKLHRRLLMKGYANRPSYVSLWIHILLSVNHQEKEFLWNDRLITIKPGQFITGRKELSESTGIPETTIERILNIFVHDAQIGQQKTSKYRLITVLNWDKHQIVDNKRTTSGQQADTNKKDKKDNNNIKEANASLSLEDNSNTMAWNKQSDDLEEITIDIDGDGVPKPKKKSTAKYPNAPTIRKVFQEVLRNNPANWKMNKTQLQACENLYTERGCEKVRNALEFYLEVKDQEFCPLISSPYDLDSKYDKLANLKNKS